MPLPSSFKLNTGASIPAVGFGTWQAAPHEVENAVEEALKQGYRHIDGAAIYRNEKEVGAGIKKSGVKREEIFLTGKLASKQSLDSLIRLEAVSRFCQVYLWSSEDEASRHGQACFLDTQEQRSGQITTC